VYSHLNALELSISVHQRCYVTFKMHQIHIRRRPMRTMGSSPHSLVVWDLGQRGTAGRTFAPGDTDSRAATDYEKNLVVHFYDSWAATNK